LQPVQDEQRALDSVHLAQAAVNPFSRGALIDRTNQTQGVI